MNSVVQKILQLSTPFSSIFPMHHAVNALSMGPVSHFVKAGKKLHIPLY